MSEVAEQDTPVVKIGIDYSADWRMSAEKSGPDVWLYVRTAAMSGGVLCTPDQARDLARVLVSAANEVEA